MASPQPVLETDEKYETLSHLYLLLWKQLDVVSGVKWLDVRPSDPQGLRHEAEEALSAIRPLIKDGDFWQVVEADFNRVQELSQHPDDTPMPEIESLKNYLRDQALRYAEESERSS